MKKDQSGAQTGLIGVKEPLFPSITARLPGKRREVFFLSELNEKDTVCEIKAGAVGKVDIANGNPPSPHLRLRSQSADSKQVCMSVTKQLEEPSLTK